MIGIQIEELFQRLKKKKKMKIREEKIIKHIERMNLRLQIWSTVFQKWNREKGGDKISKEIRQEKFSEIKRMYILSLKSSYWLLSTLIILL